MPFLSPDVIKLDLRLVQENPSRQIAEIVKDWSSPQAPELIKRMGARAPTMMKVD